MVNPKMVTPPISTKLISFESSNQMPPARATFRLLVHDLDLNLFPEHLPFPENAARVEAFIITGVVHQGCHKYYKI